MESYETLSEAISALKEQGYTADFNLKVNCLECIAGRQELLPHEFNIDKSFRFDVDENPADHAVLYTISFISQHIKRILINAVGI